jgi:ArsR family transcriptional regulator
MKSIAEKQLQSLKTSLRDDATVARLVETYKVLGDPTRLKLCMLLARAELCVGDLAGLLGISDSAISHQLRLLRSLRLVKCRRQGRRAFYTLDDDHVRSLLQQGLDHVREEEAG